MSGRRIGGFSTPTPVVPPAPMNPIVYAIPVFMLTIVLEAWWAWRQRRAVYDIPDAVTSLHHGLLSQVMGVFTKFTKFGIYALVYEAFRATEWPLEPWWLWLLALVFYDFCYYWAHRMGHEVNVLWASHVVHHSSEYYNLSTALRQTSSGWLFGWIFYLPMAVAGVPPIMFVVFVVPIVAFPMPGPLVPGITLVDIESVPSSTLVALMAVVPAGVCVSLEALAALMAPGPS